MNRSPLHDRHLALGARIVPFAGWEMPIQYQGIVAEHQAVRSAAGIFDISHMGEFEVEGPGAMAWLNGLLTNDVSALAVGEGHYTLLLNECGGVIDDLIVYRPGEERYFLVVNAARIEQDREWMLAHPGEGVTFRDRSAELGAFAVQGPKAVALWHEIEPGAGGMPGHNRISELGHVTLCGTGYTGEEGFEFFAPVEEIGAWWDRFVAAGAVPCGLGARDTLRLEKGYPLNGNDLDEVHTPLEAGLGFFVKLDKPGGFIGRDPLQSQKEQGIPTRLSAIRLLDKAPPLRHGYEVLAANGSGKVAELTSGSLSPGLGLGVGLAYLPAEMARPGTELLIAIRDKTYPAKVVKKPFV
jgi:aminomethyltransferase